MVGLKLVAVSQEESRGRCPDCAGHFGLGFLLRQDRYLKLHISEFSLWHSG